MPRQGTGGWQRAGRGEGEALGGHGEMNGTRELAEGLRGQRRTPPPPEEQNRFHLQRIKTAKTTDKRRRRSQRKPRRASTEGSRVERVCTVPCLAPGMGKGLSPARGTSLSTQKRKEKRAGSAGANGLGCPDTSAGTEPRGHRSGRSLPPQRAHVAAVHSPEGARPSQLRRRASSLPAARPAALVELGRGGDRLRPFIGQIQGTSTFPQGVKANHLYPLPHLLTPSRPLKMSHC